MTMYSRIDIQSQNYPTTNRIKTTISILSREKEMNIGISADRAKNIKKKSTSQIQKHQMSHRSIEIENTQGHFRH